MIIAGPPDLGKKNPNKKILSYLNNAEALAAFQGYKGAFMQLISRENGQKQAEYKLNGMPVFDGMSIAQEKIFIAQVIIQPFEYLPKNNLRVDDRLSMVANHEGSWFSIWCVQGERPVRVAAVAVSQRPFRRVSRTL